MPGPVGGGHRLRRRTDVRGTLPGQRASDARSRSHRPGESVDYKAGAALSWNVHSHEAGRTIIHREGRDSGGSVSFTAESAGVYSYLWKNDATTETTLEVTTTLGTGVSVHSWHP